MEKFSVNKSPFLQGKCSPGAPAEARRWIFFYFGKFGGKFGGNFAGFFLTHEIKAQKFQGEFRSIFREKIRASIKNLSCQLRSADVPP